ncbi:MAG: esterase [Crocinitomicaceae bacterium]|jgi:esterase
MKLSVRELGEGEPLMILHGLFGSSDNWQSHALKLAEYYRVILVDLRNHGHSEWSEDSSYEAMADDIFELCQEMNLEDLLLVGHSMGGKVAMHFALKHEDLLEKLIIVDMGIRSYPMHHDHILAGIHAIDVSKIKSRREADVQMSAHVESKGVKQFLLKNLYWIEKGKLAWRMNIDVLEREMHEILKALPSGEVMTSTLFIRGELSNYVLDEDMPTIESQFIDVEFVTISDAGHWVHSEQPSLFLESLLSFCLR